MLVKRLYILALMIFSHFLSFGQVFPLPAAEIYSPNKITNLTDQKLILFEFWATWCLPCRPATEQLQVLQHEINQDVFIVSVSNEKHDVITNYLKKHPNNLMIVRDYNNNLVQYFNVQRWPHAYLLTSKGNIIWEGHPSELSVAYLKKVAEKYRLYPSVKVEDIFEIKEINNKSLPHVAKQLSVKQCSITSPTFNIGDNTVYFSGPIDNLFAKLSRMPKRRFISNQWQNFYVQLECPVEMWNLQPDSILQNISKKFNINLSTDSKIEESYILEITDSDKLWDDTQFSIGNGSVSNYIIGANNLQADNMTITEVSNLLSDIKQKNYMYFGDNSGRYDWDFQFTYDDLMIQELFDEYGIMLRKTKVEVTYMVLD